MSYISDETLTKVAMDEAAYRVSRFLHFVDLDDLEKRKLKLEIANAIIKIVSEVRDND